MQQANPELVRALKAWRFERNLYLWGRVGAGKTFLAACLLRSAFEAGWDVANIPAWRACDEMRDGIPEYARWRFLLLDDVDKIQGDEWRLTRLYHLLDDRARRGVRTLFTANVAPAGLARTWSAPGLRCESLVPALLDRMRPLDAHEVKGLSVRGRL